MASFRLLDIYTGGVTSHQLSASTPYLAISHAWSEALFPPGIDFLRSPGYPMLLAVAKERFAGIMHCWIDTICINQSDDDDKDRQIPLMGHIFGDAVAVLILLNTNLRLDQEEVDRYSRRLKPAVEMRETESWQEEGMYWQSSDGGRSLIVQAMLGISRLTKTAWATRVWTLQEYILGRQIVWVGLDLKPITVSDILSSALPIICDTLDLEECIGGEFERIHSFFSGMANFRLRLGDKTRVMELLGNRSASVACDEIYGVMAASGVSIPSRAGLSREEAWQLWCEEAVRQDHIRWLLMPEVLNPSPPTKTRNCAFTPFAVRHKASSNSGLDTVTPLAPTGVQEEGTAEVSGRWVGSCKVIARLGRVHYQSPKQIRRDITLILFGRGGWQLACHIASVFGGGRYNTKQLRLIARVLTNNYWQCRMATESQRENSFHPRFSNAYQAYVWSDFMTLQMSQMPAMNDGIAYLVKIVRSPEACLDAAIVLGDYMPSARLEVIDIGGRTVSGRCVFMVVERPPSPSLTLQSHSFCSSEASAVADNRSIWFLNTVLHKVAVTLPITDDFEAVISHLPLMRFKVGGKGCWVCGANQSQGVSEQTCAKKARPAQSQTFTGIQGKAMRRVR